ncbi:3-hydroxyisobutyryl-CoA hydrolase 1 [Spatholobus suberectus]|nr:3-hydroxyisobutyryl-CoA hydrolase 1 [Spatholobus suberectus]
MASPSKGDDDQLLVQRKSYARVLTLNRPKQLNALSFHMVSRLLEIFSEDEENSDIKLVVVKGNGRAFCAGGDVATVARDASKVPCNVVRIADDLMILQGDSKSEWS